MLPNVVRPCKIVLYADYATCVLPGKMSSLFKTILQENLNVAGEWFSRTEQIAVKLYKNQSNAVLLLKYFGLTLDVSLN